MSSPIATAVRREVSGSATPATNYKALALACLLALGSSGCLHEMSLRDEFHTPSLHTKPSADLRLALRVGEDVGPQPSSLICIPYWFKVRWKDALLPPLTAELSRFASDVRVLSDRESAQDYDLVVAPKIETTWDPTQRVHLSLDFRRPDTGRSVASISGSYEGRMVVACNPVLIAVGVYVPPVLWIAARRGAARFKSETEQGLSRAILELSGKLQEHAGLRQYKQNRQRAKAQRASARAALGRGARNEAFRFYTQSIELEKSLGGTDESTVDGYLQLVGKMARLPSVPKPAERHMMRGQILFREAEDADAFGLAAKEMQSAIEMAPWWSEAYFNLALVQEASGEYGAAARNLGRYLSASPLAEDAEAVREKLLEMELKDERERASTPAGHTSY